MVCGVCAKTNAAEENMQSFENISHSSSFLQKPFA